MFQHMTEQEDHDTNSIATIPSAISETDVIISDSKDTAPFVGSSRGASVNEAARVSCCSASGATVVGQKANACGTRLAHVVRQKVAAPQNTACKLLRKSTSAKYRRFPFTMVQVLLSGLVLLVVILCCIIIETWWSAVKSTSPPKSAFLPSTNLDYEPHSPEDRYYHEKLVEDVNSNWKAKWKAKYNKFASRASDPQIMDKESLRVALTKNIETHEWSKSQMLADTESHLRHLSSLHNFTLPKKFDTRFRWPECASIHRVVNQGGCGSCWAMAATSVMSDRICIHSKGASQPHISAQDLIECCRHCGGCRGTVWALFSLVHWKERGIVTGSDYGSFQGCKPYGKSPSCGSPCSIDVYNAGRNTPRDFCYSSCQNLYDIPYQQDLHRAKTAYWVKPNVLNNVIYTKTMKQIGEMLRQNNVNYETLIKRELMLNGPLIACFVVYDEFQHYKSGIYEPQTSQRTRELYGHCAKLIGWGEDENGNRFWTYMNTWGHLWGENGFFRVDIKQVPEEAAAGIPLL